MTERCDAPYLASVQQGLEQLKVRDVGTLEQRLVDALQEIAGCVPIGVPSDRRFLVYLAESLVQSSENERQRRSHVIGRPFGRRQNVVHVSPEPAAGHGGRIVR